VDERTLAFVFAPADHTYDLNIALAADLCALGSHVILITGQILPSKREELQQIDRLDIWEIPTSPVVFAPFLEILPVEFFIYEFACWQGLTPGVFRACTPITLAETGSLATRQG
jgi:fructoselysine-6-P-deglycase FrlB-like protein